MDNVSIKLDLPKDILLAANISEASASRDVKKYLSLYMFKERLLSFGKAADLAGMDKLSFMELAGSKGISLNYDENDYLEDLQIIKRLAL